MRHRFCIKTHSLRKFISSEVTMNVKSVALTSIVLMSLVALYGCSPDDDTATGSPLITGPLAALQGTWKYHCYAESGKHAEIIYKISGTNISTSKVYYQNSSCTDESYKEEGAYSDLSLGDNITSGKFSEYQITYTVGSYGRTPLDNATTNSFAGECGISDWTENSYTNLLDNDDCGFPKNTTFLNVYKVIGNNLYLGDPIDAASRTAFPTEAKSNFIYVKQ